MPTDGVTQHRALTYQQLSGPVQHQGGLLLLRLDRNKPHRWSRHCLADRRCIVRVVLATLEIGLHVVRRHQLPVVIRKRVSRAKLLEFFAGLRPRLMAHMFEVVAYVQPGFPQQPDWAEDMRLSGVVLGGAPYDPLPNSQPPPARDR